MDQNRTPPLHVLTYLAWCFATASLMIYLTGCEPPKPSVQPSDEKLVLEKLGDANVESVSLFQTVGGADSKVVDEAFDKVMASDPTVGARIVFCRQTPNCVPVELHLAQPFEATDVQATFGPFGAKTRKTYSVTGQEIDFYRYGDLELGLDGNKVVVVVVNK